MQSSSNRLMPIKGFLSQTRFFFSRHVFEPRLILGGPEQNPETGEIPIPNDRKKPVILLLGWAGAKQSILEKYANIYHKNGYQTVCFTSPCYHYRIPNSRYGFYMSPLFRGLDAGRFGDFRNLKHNPIIVHSFSMNGIRSLISLYKWSEAEQREHLRDRIKGIIFDSAPAVTQAGPAAQAVVDSTPPLEGWEWVSPRLREIYIKNMFKLRNFFMNPLIYVYPTIRTQFSQYYWIQSYIDLPEPQLYIYSKADFMIRHKYVTRFAYYQKDLGKDVKLLEVPESEHVKHYLTAPELYEEACMELVRRTEKTLQR